MKHGTPYILSAAALALALSVACSSNGTADSTGSPQEGGVHAGGASGQGGMTSRGAGGSAPDVKSVLHPTRPSCPGVVANPAIVTCVSGTDCAEGQRCAFENSPPPPQAQCMLGCAGPFDECGATAPCPSDKVCDQGTPGGFCSCGGGSRCIPKCVTAKDCAAGMSCEADGSCKAISCEAGFPCPAAETCDAKGGLTDEHGCRSLRCDEPGGAPCGPNLECVPTKGCAIKACKTGSDCDCGACSPELVGGVRQCVSRAGYCMPAF